MAVHHSDIACAGATRIWHLGRGASTRTSWTVGCAPAPTTRAGASEGRGVAYPTAAHSSHTQDFLVAASAASAAAARLNGSTGGVNDEYTTVVGSFASSSHASEIRSGNPGDATSVNKAWSSGTARGQYPRVRFYFMLPMCNECAAPTVLDGSCRVVSCASTQP